MTRETKQLLLIESPLYVLAILALGWAFACAPEPESSTHEPPAYTTVKLGGDEGRMKLVVADGVPCMVLLGTGVADLDCDWSRAVLHQRIDTVQPVQPERDTLP